MYIYIFFFKKTLQLVRRYFRELQLPVWCVGVVCFLEKNHAKQHTGNHFSVPEGLTSVSSFTCDCTLPAHKWYVVVCTALCKSNIRYFCISVWLSVEHSVFGQTQHVTCYWNKRSCCLSRHSCIYVCMHVGTYLFIFHNSVISVGPQVENGLLWCCNLTSYWTLPPPPLPSHTHTHTNLDLILNDKSIIFKFSPYCKV